VVLIQAVGDDDFEEMLASLTQWSAFAFEVS
jgi:hypothetical protein